MFVVRSLSCLTREEVAEGGMQLICRGLFSKKSKTHTFFQQTLSVWGGEEEFDEPIGRRER
jgi:hypothetical protein